MPSEQQPELDIELIQNLDDALAVAQLRNSGREFMTHNTDSLSVEKQTAWYDGTYLPDVAEKKMFCFLGKVAGQPASYSLIREYNGRFWVTGVVSDQFRGQGYGKVLLAHLEDYIFTNLSDEVWLDVLATNKPAVGLYTKLGYKEVSKKDGKIVMSKGKKREAKTSKTKS